MICFSHMALRVRNASQSHEYPTGPGVKGESAWGIPYQYCKKLAAMASLSLALAVVEGIPRELNESPSRLARFRALLEVGRDSFLLEFLP